MTEEPDTRQRAGGLRKGGPVKPQYLADAHRLAERGWLVQKSIGGQLTYWLSGQGAKALELDGLQMLEPGQQN